MLQRIQHAAPARAGDAAALPDHTRGALLLPQVDAYMFGSVPLRTFLPDGDIDLSVFCSQETAASMRDTWAVKLQAMIEAEQQSGAAPYKIGDVTVINAEVRTSMRACEHASMLAHGAAALGRPMAAGAAKAASSKGSPLHEQQQQHRRQIERLARLLACWI